MLNFCWAEVVLGRTSKKLPPRNKVAFGIAHRDLRRKGGAGAGVEKNMIFGEKWVVRFQQLRPFLLKKRSRSI